MVILVHQASTKTFLLESVVQGIAYAHMLLARPLMKSIWAQREACRWQASLNVDVATVHTVQPQLRQRRRQHVHSFRPRQVPQQNVDNDPIEKHASFIVSQYRSDPLPSFNCDTSPRLTCSLHTSLEYNIHAIGSNSTCLSQPTPRKRSALFLLAWNAPPWSFKLFQPHMQDNTFHSSP